jgi:hypothetical protein
MLCCPPGPTQTVVQFPAGQVKSSCSVPLTVPANATELVAMATKMNNPNLPIMRAPYEMLLILLQVGPTVQLQSVGSLARTAEFVEPDQSDLPCPVPFAKIFRFVPDPNHFISPAVPPHTEGRFAIVTDVGSGMRWTRMVLLTRAPSRGRRSRVVLTPRRRRQVGGSNSAGDGDKQARSPGRVRRKPLKPLACGNAG